MYSNMTNPIFQINTDSAINPDHLSYFHFVGRIMGIAMFHGHYIDGGFTMPFYKVTRRFVMSDIIHTLIVVDVVE